MKITLFCLLLALTIALGKPYYEDEDDDEYEALQDMPDDYFEENLDNELDAGKSKVNPPKKPSAKKPAAKKPTKKPAAKKPTKKPAAKKPAAKKPTKKPMGKKPAAKKPKKKPAGKKPAAKKPKKKPSRPIHHCQKACVIFKRCMSSRVHNNHCHMAFTVCKRCMSGRHRG